MDDLYYLEEENSKYSRAVIDRILFQRTVLRLKRAIPANADSSEFKDGFKTGWKSACNAILCAFDLDPFCNPDGERSVDEDKT